MTEAKKQEKQEKQESHDYLYDEETGIVSFLLADGATEVILNPYTPKKLGIISAECETYYRTGDPSIPFKPKEWQMTFASIAGLCSKWGDRNPEEISLVFIDEYFDRPTSFKDIKICTKALEFFRPMLEDVEKSV